MNVPSKNYIGELQEYCQTAHSKMPEYVDESIGSTFKFVCKLNDWVSVGTGGSKKIAKQNAAREMITLSENGKLLKNVSPESNDSLTSSISKLVIFCTKECKEPPLFAELPKEEDLFCFKCTVEEFSAIGQGKNKKEAKELAAFKVAEHFGVNTWHDNMLKLKERIQEQLGSVQNLLVFCQKKKLAAPIYKEEERKTARGTEYKMNCIVGDLVVEGLWAHSKKSAKLEVSSLMLQSLNGMTPQASPMRQSEKSELKIGLYNREIEILFEPFTTGNLKRKLPETEDLKEDVPPTKLKATS